MWQKWMLGVNNGSRNTGGIDQNSLLMLRETGTETQYHEAHVPVYI